MLVGADTLLLSERVRCSRDFWAPKTSPFCRLEPVGTVRLWVSAESLMCVSASMLCVCVFLCVHVNGECVLF